jgi:hypothetical protein
VPAAFRAEFNAAAERARSKLGTALLAPALLASVESMLAEYRTRHKEAAKR